MSEKHWSENVHDGLVQLEQGIEFLNPLAWLGKAVSSNTNYVDTALGEDGYDGRGNIRKSFADRLTGISPNALKRIQDKQVTEFMEDDETQLGQRATELGVKTKDKDGKYKKLRGIQRTVEKGENRTANLPEGVLRTDLNLPNSIATVSEDLLQQHVRKARTKLDNSSRAAAAGIDPSTLDGTAATNKAIKEQAITDEIEKSNRVSEAYENSEKGKREAATHSKGLELTDQQIDASKSNARVNEGTLDLGRVKAENTQTLNLYDRDVDKYRYEDGKHEKGLDRQFEADREDARFAANLETIKLQNAAEMERYEMMLQNDKEVREGDSISDLMSALTMLGGAFML